MASREIRVRSSQGGEFDCYLALPEGKAQLPAAVLACEIQGVDQDLRDIADELAANGFIAAAPDLFWRAIPGALPRGDPRIAQRTEPRLQRIADGEPDLLDTLAEVRRQAQSNGKAAVIGFCYGGPYAILGPKRLGYAAGISCHGSRMDAYLQALEGTTQPLCFLWGDRDHAAPPDLLAAYRAASMRMPNVEVRVFPGVQHGYMMPAASGQAFDRCARDSSMQRIRAVLDGLRH